MVFDIGIGGVFLVHNDTGVHAEKKLINIMQNFCQILFIWWYRFGQSDVYSITKVFSPTDFYFIETMIW